MTHRSFARTAVAAGLFAALATPAVAQKPYDDPVLERMRKDIFFLASSECEGRGVETKGINLAADYIADTFKRAGLKPAMKDGSYFQPFTIIDKLKLDSPTKAVLTGPDGKLKELELRADYSPMGFSPTSKVSGELVFVGYGITAPELKYDDYAGLDVSGKVVVVLRHLPRSSETGEKRFDTTVGPKEQSKHEPFVAKIENAIKHNAAGIIFVNNSEEAGFRDPILQYSNNAFGASPAPFPVLFLKRAVLNDLLAGGPVKSVADRETLIDKDMKPRSFPISGWKFDAVVTIKRSDFKVKNVVGVLEGSGPLADETIVLGAHYDHVGYGSFGSLGGPTAVGKIHYGADDNASGATTLMELARRFSAMKGRQGRRLVFIAFSGEERGLFGSKYYCEKPLFPLAKTAAMINMDMVGRTKPVPSDWLGLAPYKDRLIVYGTGTAEGFAKLVDQAGAKNDFKLSTLPTGMGPSDQESFYLKQIPVLFLYTGTHGEYHRPTDVPEKINVPGMKKVADLVQILAEHMTTEPRPKFQATQDEWVDPTESKSPHGDKSLPAKAPRLRVLPNYEYEGGDGVLIDGVAPGGAAEKGGLKAGDVIVEVAGKPIKNVTGYMSVMSAQKVGVTIEVVVLRKEKRMALKVTPE